MGALAYRAAKLAAAISFAAIISFSTPALAQAPEISAADTAWMMVATALVLMMTIPGLALFYAGMVRKKNVLATMAQSLAAVAIISILWVAFGYSLAFVGDGPWLGDAGSLVSRRYVDGRGQSRRQDDPRGAVHALPDDVRDHHGGAGGRLGRRPDAVLGLSVVLGRLVRVRLYSAGALGLGRRIPRQRRRDGFRRRPGGASECRSRRPGGCQGTRPPPRLWQRESVAVRPVAGGDRHRPAVGRLVRLQRRIGAGRRIHARSWRSSPPISPPVPGR